VNDLDLLRTMRSDTPPPSQDALRRARSRLLDRAASRVRWLPPRLRAGWQTAAAATIVIVLGVGAIVSTYERAGGPADRSAAPTESDAVRVALAEAAAGARTAPAVHATKGQFWYFKEVYRVIQPDVGADEDNMTAEYWYRVGNERPGGLGRIHFEYEFGDVLDIVWNGSQTVVRQNGQVVEERTLRLPLWFRDDPTDPSSRWLPEALAATAPTTAADVVEFLRNVPPGDNPGSDLGGIIGLLFHPVLSPQQRAAACEALGQLPDLSLVPDTVDIAGRHGVGIVSDSGFSRLTLILDSSSCEVLGLETTVVKPVVNPTSVPDRFRGNLQPGSGNAEAILARGVVDSVDERP